MGDNGRAIRVLWAALAVSLLAAITPVVASAPARAAEPVRTFGVAPDLIVNDVAYDTATGTAYLVVPGHADAFPNHLVAFDPGTGAILGAVWVGSEPSTLELTADGGTIWIGLDGSGSVIAVDARSMTVVQTIPLGWDSFGDPRAAADLSAVPGNADAVLVATRDARATRGRHVVALIDGGRVAETANARGEWVVAISATEGVGVEDGRLSRIAIGTDGVTEIETFATSIHGAFSVHDGVVFGPGPAIDRLTGARIALFDGPVLDRPIIRDERIYTLVDREIRPYWLDSFGSAGDAIEVPAGAERFEFTDAGWLAWSGGLVDDHRFVTPTRGVEPTIDAEVGVRSFAETPMVAVTDAVVHQGSGLVYASVATNDAVYGDHLVAFDPSTGVIVGSVMVGRDPSIVELSVDGSTVWVGLGGSNAVVAVDRVTMTVDSTVSLGSDAVGPRYARDLAPIPDDHDAVAIALRSERGSPSHRGVALVDEGVLAPSIVFDGIGADVIEAVDSGRVVGVTTLTTAWTFWRLDIGPDGVVRELDGLQTLVAGGGDPLVRDGLLYGSGGPVIDAATGEGVGTFPKAGSDVRPVITSDLAYLFDANLDQLVLFDRSRFHRLPYPVQFESRLDGMELTDHGWIAWSGGLFVTGEIVVGSGTLRGFVVDDQTGAPIRDLCVRAFTAGDLSTAPVGQALTTSSGQWSMQVPEGDYWLLYRECFFLDYFGEWHDDTALLRSDEIEIVTVAPDSERMFVAELRPLFTDVPRDAFYFGSTIFLWDSRITAGCGVLQYCPDDAVTREQMAAFIARFWRFLSECPNAAPSFLDVPGSSFAYRDVGCLAALGITTGTSPTSYSPQQAVTREQMAAFIARVWRGLGFTCPTGSMPFSDVRVGSFAYDDIICILLLGVTTGTSPTTYSPQEFVTRGQMAAFLERLFHAVVDRVDGPSLATLLSSPTDADVVRSPSGPLAGTVRGHGPERRTA